LAFELKGLVIMAEESKIANNEQKVAGLIKLLTSFKPLDYKEAAVKYAMDTETFTTNFPGGVAQNLSDDVGYMLTQSDTIGEFILNGIETILSIAIAIGHQFGAVVTPNQMTELVIWFEKYQSAPEGSPMEVIAKKKMGEIVEDINDTALRRFPSMVASYADAEDGFAASATQALSSDEDDESDESDDEIVTH
jgi:hypothetical protein